MIKWMFKKFCTPSTRCIICSKCEAVIVERERKRCAKVADDHLCKPSEKDKHDCADIIVQDILKDP